ncbi:MAG: hypothetical protein M3Q65_20470, partial [Chloroflexota bacterium]|nr:hypothetical protein [Chloroflexota bacterium]
MSRAARPLLLLAVLLLADFALPRLLPGDPVAAPTAGGGQDAPVALTPEARARLLAYYGLDRPLPAQFGRFLLATARGDLGFSIAFNQPVRALIARRVGWTLFLVGHAANSWGLARVAPDPPRRRWRARSRRSRRLPSHTKGVGA